jgi:hypothetical protein
MSKQGLNVGHCDELTPTTNSPTATAIIVVVDIAQARESLNLWKDTRFKPYISPTCSKFQPWPGSPARIDRLSSTPRRVANTAQKAPQPTPTMAATATKMSW